MTRQQQIAIMRNFPLRAEVYEAFHAVKTVIDRAPARPSDAALARLISSLKLIYRRYANQPITMRIDCSFVGLVAAAADARGWSAAGLTIRDIEEQMRPKSLGDRFGRRAVRAGG